MEGCGSGASVVWDETLEDNICAKEGADTCLKRGQ